METVLITPDDVIQFREISQKWKTKLDRFNAFAREVQRVNLRDLLGQALYYAFFNDFSSGVPQEQKYKDLLNGKTYTYSSDTIEYLGLKPYICYHWLAKDAREGEHFHSIVGGINYNDNPQQHFIASKQAHKVADSYLETATIYRNDIVRYLNEHSSTYDLWDGDGETNRNQFKVHVI